jgi:formate dehydrogenase maturation protein FdhE
MAKGYPGEINKNKRNAFQREQDKRLAIEMLQKGCNYLQIAAAISEIQPYSISYQQVIKDLDSVRLDAIAKSSASMGEIIDQEMQEIEFAIAEVKEAIAKGKEEVVVTSREDSEKNGTKETEKRQYNNLNPAYVTALLNAAARRSALLGIDSHLKHQDINTAIESLTSRGYVVSLPDGDESAGSSNPPQE